MGMIRNLLVTLISILLFISLLALGGLFTVSSSLEYENVQDNLAPVVAEIVNDTVPLDELNEGFEFIVNYCSESEEVIYQSVVLGKPVVIPCETLEQGVDSVVEEARAENSELDKSSSRETFKKNVNSSYSSLMDFCLSHERVFINDTENFDEGLNISCESALEGPTAVIEEQIENQIEDLYYETSDCELFDCIEENPLSFVSENTRDYFWGKFITMLTVSIVLFLVLLILVESKVSAFFIAGACMIVAGIPIFLLDKFLAWFVDIQFLSILTFFASEANSVFYTFLIFGILLIVVGILWKIFNWGFKIGAFLNKFKGSSKPSKPAQTPSKSSK